jgi:NADH dehydrogenase
MSDILIVGGGFAGVRSAAAAARARELAGSDLSITLVAPGDDLVIRPRLYEAEPGRMRVPLDRVLRPIGVRRVQATVTAIDPVRRTVSARDREGRRRTLGYRRLVLAAGSHLRRPDVPGAEHLHDVDTVEAAAALDAHVRALPPGPGRWTAVVVGAGFTGLEVATELAGRLPALAARAGDGARDPARVVLVERAAVVGPDLGPGPRPVIEAALAELGVDVRLAQTVESVTAAGARLADGTEVATGTVIWTAGMQASSLTIGVPGRRDGLGRLHVDAHLRVPEAPEVLAAGDTAAAAAEPGHLVMQSCQHAMPLGQHAGHNAAADLLGVAPIPFQPKPYTTCLDLGPAGAVLTEGFARRVRSTGAEAKERKRTINQEWIYPPLDDRDAILRWGDPRAVTGRPPDSGRSPAAARTS